MTVAPPSRFPRSPRSHPHLRMSDGIVWPCRSALGASAAFVLPLDAMHVYMVSGPISSARRARLRSARVTALIVLIQSRRQSAPEPGALAGTQGSWVPWEGGRRKRTGVRIRVGVGIGEAVWTCSGAGVWELGFGN